MVTDAGCVVYSSLGRVMHVFGLDRASGALAALQQLEFPATIQCGWANRRATRLYVISSAGGPMAEVKRPDHFVQALEIRGDGTLEPLGVPRRLANRPLHLCLDGDETHLLIAYNDPSEVTVHAVDGEGGIGTAIAQPALDLGPTVHQVRLTPAGNVAVVPCCAHHPTGDDAGSVSLLAYRDGRLAPMARIEADPARAAAWQGVRWGAQGFAARHVDFHPARPWMYLCVEKQGELHLFDCDGQGVATRPRAVRSTLDGVALGRSSQLASAIHVHPDGRCVYVTNRARETESVDGRAVFVGGVNDIAVFAIDPHDGTPSLIQHIDTQGIFPHTFGIDASGSVLVAGNQEPMEVRDGAGFRRVLPGVVVYRIGADGRLAFMARHDHADNGEVCFWTGVVTPGVGGTL